MITIQSTLLVSLGFLIASLIVLMVAPAYWRRAVTLTTRRLKQSMPLTESEINADKDRIRAEFAIKVHKLETRAEASALAAARQQIELNRRDAAISALETEAARLRTTLEEHENARRVLEQTIQDRFPKVEHRLNEARKLLLQRDREIQTLSEMGSRQSRALEEATQINTQQRDELMRLNSSLAARAARNRETLSDPRFDAEIALRSELESLRAANREQAALMARLQTPHGADRDAALAVAQTANGDTTVERLKSDLLEAEAALKAARGEAATGQAGRADFEAEVRALRARAEDQDAQIARLTAALKTFEAGDSADRSISLKDSRIAMKARVSSLQAEVEQQTQTIQRLRAEIATGNERLARQAAHFMDEMRRIGAGTLPSATGGDGRRIAPQAAAARPRPLSERIREPRANPASRPEGPASGSAHPAVGSVAVLEQDAGRVNGFLRALGGASAARAADQAASGRADDPTSAVLASSASATVAAATGPASPDLGATGDTGPPRKGRLLERLAAANGKAESGAA